MDCKDCLKKNSQIFKDKCHLFEDRHHLAFFLINIILNIQDLWTDFCRCDGIQICLVCQENMFYKNFEYKVYHNSLDLNFLAKLRENVYRNLERFLTLDNHFVCKIVNHKYQYFHKDWFTGEKWKFDLDYCLTSYEHKKIDNIIGNNCKVVLKKIQVVFNFFCKNGILFGENKRSSL